MKNYFTIQNDIGDKLTFARSYKGFALTVRDAQGNEAMVDLPGLRWLDAFRSMRNVVMNSFRQEKGALGEINR